MIRSLKLLLAASFAASLIAAAIPVTPAHAAQINVCAPTASGTSPGPGRWTAPGSGTIYSLNNGGCVLVSPVDIADALTAGFVRRSQIFSAVAYQVGAATSITIPAGTYIDRIIIQEISGLVVTGGVKIGTASGGTQVVAAAGCNPNCLVVVPDASVVTRAFPSTAPQTLFIDAVTNWTNQSGINVTIMYGYW